MRIISTRGSTSSIYRTITMFLLSIFSNLVTISSTNLRRSNSSTVSFRASFIRYSFYYLRNYRCEIRTRSITLSLIISRNVLCIFARVLLVTQLRYITRNNSRTLRCLRYLLSFFNYRFGEYFIRYHSLPLVVCC